MENNKRTDDKGREIIYFNKKRLSLHSDRTHCNICENRLNEYTRMYYIKKGTKGEYASLRSYCKVCNENIPGRMSPEKMAAYKKVYFTRQLTVKQFNKLVRNLTLKEKENILIYFSNKDEVDAFMDLMDKKYKIDHLLHPIIKPIIDKVKKKGKK